MMKDTNVLIADDSPEMLGFIRSLLNDKRLKLHAAEDGLEALDVFYREEIDIVVSDFDMPGLDGLTLASIVKENRGEKRCPFILMSGWDLPDERLKSANLFAFLKKPFSVIDFKELVKSAIDFTGTEK
ncbi:MAG TPA: response regulator [bacterium]|nr:response regulator [bacterium]